MEMSEQQVLEKHFPFKWYGKDGKATETEGIVMRELDTAELNSISRNCMIRERGQMPYRDDGKYGLMLAASMMVSAPFESAGKIIWKEMDMKQKIDCLASLTPRHAVQINRMLEDMVPNLSEDDANLSKTQ